MPKVGILLLTVMSSSSLLVVEPPMVRLLFPHPTDGHEQVMRIVSPAVAVKVPEALELLLAAVRS